MYFRTFLSYINMMIQRNDPDTGIVTEGMKMNRVRRMIGCDHREVIPYTGKGVYVAVLDSGVASHPDLRGRVAAFRDFISDKRMYYDDNGHGTHVSGILAGSGAMSKGRYQGIAPECILVCGKVLDKKGGGSLKNLTSGLIWISELIDQIPIRILNISIEMESEEGIAPEDWEQFRKYMQYLWDRNIMIVAAAGNKGQSHDIIANRRMRGVRLCRVP